MLGQVLSFLASPGSIMFALLLLSLPLSWWRATRRIGVMLGSVMLVIILGIASLPVQDWLLRPLEEYYPLSEQLPAQVDGIVVLGGAEEPEILAARGWPDLNSNADRLIAFVELASRYPQARLVFSGGAMAPVPNRIVTEADVAAAVFSRLGLDVTRVNFERQARNTVENARLSLPLVQPKPGEVWLLITSARHMPRAVACFRAVDWPVLPYPVDFHTGPPPRGFEFNLFRIGSLNSLSKEWLGLIGYRLLGYTRELLPPRKTSDAGP